MDLNYFVINIDKLSYSSNRYNLAKLNKKNYKFIKSDIKNKKVIFKALKKYQPKVIFNLAAQTHVDRSIDNPKTFIENNFVAVFNLMETIRTYNKFSEHKVKLIHVSTDEVYGDIVNKKLRADEKYQYKPSSPYAASKASADHLIKSYIRTYNFPAVISNCSNNYGPKQFPEKLIPKIIFNYLNDLSIPIYGKGKNSREWIYVMDHCRALDILSKKGKIGESYNIGSGKNLTNLQLVKLLIDILKKKIKKKTKIIFVKDRPGHDLRYALDSKKMKKQFKWSPKTSLYSGLVNTVNWYINNPSYFKSLKKKDYKFRLGLKI